MQPSREIRPNRSKQNQGKPNKIAWISLVLFVRPGLFNGLRPIQIKNLCSVSTRVPGCARNVSKLPFLLGSSPPLARASDPSCLWKNIAQSFCFSKQIPHSLLRSRAGESVRTRQAPRRAATRRRPIWAAGEGRCRRSYRAGQAQAGVTAARGGPGLRGPQGNPRRRRSRRVRDSPRRSVP
jgi:hypothetical protein